MLGNIIGAALNLGTPVVRWVVGSPGKAISIAQKVKQFHDFLVMNAELIWISTVGTHQATNMIDWLGEKYFPKFYKENVKYYNDKLNTAAKWMLIPASLLLWYSRCFTDTQKESLRELRSKIGEGEKLLQDKRVSLEVLEDKAQNAHKALQVGIDDQLKLAHKNVMTELKNKFLERTSEQLKEVISTDTTKVIELGGKVSEATGQLQNVTTAINQGQQVLEGLHSKQQGLVNLIEAQSSQLTEIGKAIEAKVVHGNILQRHICSMQKMVHGLQNAIGSLKQEHQSLYQANIEQLRLLSEKIAEAKKNGVEVISPTLGNEMKVAIKEAAEMLRGIIIKAGQAINHSEIENPQQFTTFLKQCASALKNIATNISVQEDVVSEVSGNLSSLGGQEATYITDLSDVIQQHLLGNNLYAESSNL